MAVGWGTQDTSTTLTSITTIQYFDDTPSLEPNEYAHVQITGERGAGTTDNMTVAVYSTTDASSEVWDTIPIYSFTLTLATSADAIASIIVKDVYKFRVGVTRSGSTDTLSADMTYRIATMS